MLTVQYDPQADALYVAFQGPEARAARTEEIDARRAIDYDAAGNVIGVEFLSVSQGVDLAGVPEAAAVRQALTTVRTIAVA